MAQFPSDQTPRSLEEGYAIQAATARFRGAPLAAFKVGLTSLESQRGAGAREPIAGRLAADDVLRSGQRIVLDARHLRIVEAEVIFEIGRDLPAAEAPFDEATVWDSIAGAFAGLEVCDSRFSQGDDLSLAHLVADNSNADRLVVGEPLVNWRATGLANLSINLVLQSGLSVEGSASRVLGNPGKALAWLANWLGARGEGLRRGQLVASGTCTGITEAARSDQIVAVFGAGAKATVEFESKGGTSRVRT